MGCANLVSLEGRVTLHEGEIDAPFGEPGEVLDGTLRRNRLNLEAGMPSHGGDVLCEREIGPLRGAGGEGVRRLRASLSQERRCREKKDRPSRKPPPRELAGVEHIL
jgi:hypothetical protein